MLCSQINFHHNRVVLRVVCPLFTELTQEGSTFRDPAAVWTADVQTQQSWWSDLQNTSHDFLLNKKKMI